MMLCVRWSLALDGEVGFAVVYLLLRARFWSTTFPLKNFGFLGLETRQSSFTFSFYFDHGEFRCGFLTSC